ncbi:MAG: hypothetical protein HYX29_03230 [Solirubrobacterales bacterium]|nr:hypothetical protein [Solirubrobacterales bacterium]
MSRERDTDTLTRIDLGPDAPTVKNSFTDPDAETHRLDPRAYAPLRVCPECSLAWEVTGEWCPSCGTAFDKSARESVRATRVMPARSVSPARVGSQPPLTRSARKRGVTPPPAPPKQAKAPQSGGARKVIATVLVFALAITVAFFIGQSTRPSQAQVDQSIEQAVQSAKQSAVNSYERAFAKLRDETAAAVEAARSKALAEGEAKAQANARDAEAESQSIFDSVTNCVLRGEC